MEDINMYILTIEVRNNLSDYPVDWFNHDKKQLPFLTESEISVLIELNGVVNGVRLDRYELQVTIIRKHHYDTKNNLNNYPSYINPATVSLKIEQVYVDEITSSLIKDAVLKWLGECKNKLIMEESNV